MGERQLIQLAVDVSGVCPDAASVDALAQLQLLSRRHGWQLVLRGASPELLELIDLMGLASVLPDHPSSATHRA